ncbi:MAG: FG-GAP repeat domain-containing protein, partial [Longimicrobiales bacterium]
MRPAALWATAIALGGCAASGGAGGSAGVRAAAGGDGGAHGSAGNSGYTRVIAPFSVTDENGVAYAHPFLGGLDVPRPQFVDIDADGDPDLFVQERTGDLMFLENVGTPQSAQYEWRTDDYGDLDVGEWSRIADVDGDSLYDVLGEERYSYIRFYRNTGSATHARLELAEDTIKNADGEAIFSDRQNIPQVVDFDCDGMLDLFLGRVDGTITRYEEAATDTRDPRFYFVTDRFENIEIIGQLVGSARHGANSMFFADTDEDGDHDLYWGDFFEPGVLYIENTGSCRNPVLRDTPRPVTADGDSIATSGYNAPYLADIDADDDLDLFLGVLGGAFNPNRTAADNFHFYERTADGALALRSDRFLDGLD